MNPQQSEASMFVMYEIGRYHNLLSTNDSYAALDLFGLIEVADRIVEDWCKNFDTEGNEEVAYVSPYAVRRLLEMFPPQKQGVSR